MENPTTQDQDFVVTAVKKDLERLAEWASSVYTELPHSQVHFHLSHTHRRLQRLEAESYHEVKVELTQIIENLPRGGFGLHDRVQLAEKLVAIRYRF